MMSSTLPHLSLKLRLKPSRVFWLKCTLQGLLAEVYLDILFDSPQIATWISRV